VKWLDNINYLPLAITALLLGLAPFSPEPHLLEKSRMLLNGSLVKPLDMFDLLFHGSVPLLLAIKIFRSGQKKTRQ
jgi:hypothetical protein